MSNINKYRKKIETNDEKKSVRIIMIRNKWKRINKNVELKNRVE